MISSAAALPKPRHPDPPGYTGPADGLSHYNKRAAAVLRPLNNVAMSLLVRKEVVGAENLPKDGSHLLAFNHQSYIDPPLLETLDKRDWRFMAAKEQFVGVSGKAMSACGAFPVDRDASVARPLEVSIDLLNEGKGVAIFPEGRIWSDGAVHELKEGTAMVALRSKCETVVPGAISYKTHTPTLGSKLLHYGAAAAITAGGLACAMSGNPLLQGAAGLVTGFIGGGLAGAAVGAACAGAKADPKQRVVAAVEGLAVGAAAVAVVGALTAHALVVAAPLAVVAGFATLLVGKALGQRQDVTMVVGTPIPVEPYRQMANHKEARTRLTEDLHTAMVALKARADH